MALIVAARTEPMVSKPVPAGVLVALNQRDQDYFFNGTRRERLRGEHWTCDADLASPARWREALHSIRPEILVSGWSTPPLPQDWISDKSCPLQYVSHVAGSVRGVVPRAFLERGGRVTNWGNRAAREVAEHALLLALGLLRGLPRWAGLRVEAGGAPSSALLGTRTLFGREVGIHGFGGVAQALRALLAIFEVKVCAFSPGVPESLMQAAGVEPCRSLRDLFARSEVLFECEALTPESVHCVNDEVLSALRDGAVFVNVARGGIVEEAALFRHAETGRLHVAIDVVDEEPPPVHPFFARFPNVLFSPHIAGPTFDSLPQFGRHALENVARYLRREPLEAEINLEIYDRST